MVKRFLLGFITGLLIISIAFVGVAELTGNSVITKSGKGNPVLGKMLVVAMPIFTAVTKTASTKTCLANQREIVSQLNNYFMMYNVQDSGSISIYSDGYSAYDVWSNMYYLDEYTFEELFQETPWCPDGGTYEVYVSYDSAEGYSTVDVYCDCHGSYNSQ